MRITSLPNIRRAVAESVWVIHEAKLHAIAEVLAIRTSETPLTPEDVQARIGDKHVAARTPVLSGSVAVIPLQGTLYPKANFVTDSSGGQSVAQFVAQMEAAASDPNVSAIVIDVDSPGGNAQGIPEAAARIRALRGTKPIVAVATGMMASGAYWLGAQADSVVGSPSSEIGSVGAFMMHQDVSEALAKDGVKMTLIRAGKYKAETNPFEPLTDEAKAALLGRVEDAYTMFVNDLAKGRGVSAATVRSDFGEGRVLSPKNALAAGMIDRLGTLEQVVRDLAGPNAKKYTRHATEDLMAIAAHEDVALLTEFRVPATLSADEVTSLTHALATQGAGSVTACIPSSNPTPPLAEEHIVPPVSETPTNAASSAATAEPSREVQLSELAVLTGNEDSLPTWIMSDKSVAEIRRGLVANQSAPPASRATNVTVGLTRETQRPWAHFGEQVQAVINAGNPNYRGERDLRLYAAAQGMSQSVPAEGGFTVAPEFSNGIWEAMSGQSDNLLNLTDNYTVTGESLTFNADAETSRATGSRRGGIQAYWMSEAAQYTKSKPTFRQVRIEPQDLGVFVYMTDKLLANSGVALGQYVSRAAADEIATMVTESLVNGTGSGQPKGIVGSGAAVTVSKETNQAADTINQLNISKMWARMHPRLRAGAVWLHNVDVEPQLDTLSTVVQNVAGTENVGGYANKVFDAERRTLKGRPLIACESCATLGDLGDLILWAPKAYLTGTRGGVNEAMSMHLRFDYNETALRFLFSVDGQPWHQSAITPLKGTNTLSSIVLLQAR